MKLIVIATDGSVARGPRSRRASSSPPRSTPLCSSCTPAPVAAARRSLYQRHLTTSSRGPRGARPAEAEAERVGVHYESEILEGDPVDCIVQAARCRRPISRRRLTRPRRPRPAR